MTRQGTPVNNEQMTTQAGLHDWHETGTWNKTKSCRLYILCYSYL